MLVAVFRDSGGDAVKRSQSRSDAVFVKGTGCMPQGILPRWWRVYRPSCRCVNMITHNAGLPSVWCWRNAVIAVYVSPVFWGYVSGELMNVYPVHGRKR